ncbi:type VII toxin-antitoxin system HepT family RNase toxin [Nitratiruptor sp. SB155-2]|uniref:type VII toxin-antitoxin system HepT family RNase toxin n=1 Tax=Nitratiruptor sp. (strain SB155-2) TaxID=387092 RepID=UPI0001587289|nr:HepT-like ribonuclease domain-containing protein [Nitratiruptor sp. SB155-2]BAF70682.1 conserved hypothetical protein [Nitratiruptor sp. SB155-2]
MEIWQKLTRLEENIKILYEIKEELDILDIRKEWEIRYGLFESIQIVIDISCKVVSKFNLGQPKNYRECIETLITHKILDRVLGEKLVRMVGLRNILINEYCEINTDKLTGFLNNLDDFKKFIEAVKEI